MVVLLMWSDQHRRTPVGVFIYEPFQFGREYQATHWQVVSEGTKAPVVSYQTLLKMKANTGRAKDLLDIEALRLDPYR